VPHVHVELSYNDASNPAELGWLASETSDGIVTSYSYTTTGAVRETKVSFAGATYKVGTSSDRTGRLTAVAYPSGRSVMYEYDLADRVRRVYDGAQDLARLAYEPGGQLAVLDNDDGLIESYLYDIRQRNTQIVSTRAQVSGDLVNDNFIWSDASDVAWIDRGGLLPGGDPRPAAQIIHVGLDPFGRLDTVSHDGLPVATYVHDRGGRLEYLKEGIGYAYKYKYDADRMTARIAGKRAIKYSYDALGNAIDETTWLGAQLVDARKHAWDALGRYIGTETDDGAWTRYFYSSQGDITRVIGPGSGEGGDTLNLGIWARVQRSTGTITDRIHAGARLIAEATGTEIEYVHRTLGGTIAAVTGADGEILRQEELHPYGDLAASYGESAIPERFHGIRRDQLDVAGGRAYDRAAGRWLGRDRLALAEPERIFSSFVTLDLYGYANGNPFHFSDESGLAPIEINAAGGHHYVPKQVTVAARFFYGLSEAAMDVFDETTTGWPVHKDIPDHGWTKTHRIYNDNMLPELERYAQANKIDLRKMTKAQAQAFIKTLATSADPVISGFVTVHDEVVADAKAGKSAKEIGARYRVHTTGFRRGGAFTMKALGFGTRLFGGVGWLGEGVELYQMYRGWRDGKVRMYKRVDGWHEYPFLPGRASIFFPPSVWVTPAEAKELKAECDPAWCA
jgi:RHS repeat-associated protein